jgi:hypothetical protein
MPTGSLDVIRRLPRTGFVSVKADGNARAVPCELAGDGRPDAARGAGDQRDVFS